MAPSIDHIAFITHNLREVEATLRAHNITYKTVSLTGRGGEREGGGGEGEWKGGNWAASSVWAALTSTRCILGSEACQCGMRAANMLLLTPPLACPVCCLYVQSEAPKAGISQVRDLAVLATRSTVSQTDDPLPTDELHIAEALRDRVTSCVTDPHHGPGPQRDRDLQLRAASGRDALPPTGTSRPTAMSWL